MKKAKTIIFWSGFSLFVLNQILVFALLNKVRQTLDLSQTGNYWESLPQYIFVLFGICLFAGYSACVLLNKPVTNQVGAILGIIFIICVFSFSWLVVTWVFWFGNVVACALLLTANVMILKLNRENM